MAQPDRQPTTHNIGGKINTAPYCSDCSLEDFCNTGAGTCHKEQVEMTELDKQTTAALVNNFFKRSVL